MCDGIAQRRALVRNISKLGFGKIMHWTCTAAASESLFILSCCISTRRGTTVPKGETTRGHNFDFVNDMSGNVDEI